MALPIPTTAQLRDGAFRDHHLRLSLVSAAHVEEEVREDEQLVEMLHPEEEAASVAQADSLCDVREPGSGSAEDQPGLVDSPEIHHEVDRLRAENARLVATVARLEQVLAEQDQLADTPFATREKEFESLLEEKSEVIRELHLKIQELQGKPSTETPREDELLALSEELERDRTQLKEDEEALMTQMREMEVQMSRERAEIARQRTELDRLQNEFHHELETAARDIALRQRLAPLQRRQQDLANRSRGADEPPATEDSEEGAANQVPTQKDRGLFRRFFG